MKSLLTISICITTITAYAQHSYNHSVKNNEMENKTIIRNLYENIFNNRKPELLDNIISSDYSDTQELKGPASFKKTFTELTTAFPDAKWAVTAIVAEGNQVFVKQTLTGTHKGIFKNIAPTNRSFISEGTALYEFKDGKIIHGDVLTDRLGFLQQLGVLPQPQNNEEQVYFVDKFKVPEAAFHEFITRTTYNRNFIKQLDGFIKDDVIISKDAAGNRLVMTIAIWKSKAHMEAAKLKVQEDYAKINFNPKQFCDQLGISMEREVYSTFQGN